jgi:hypothetical protein
MAHPLSGTTGGFSRHTGTTRRILVFCWFYPAQRAARGRHISGTLPAHTPERGEVFIFGVRGWRRCNPIRTQRATGFALFTSELAVLPDRTDTLPDQSMAGDGCPDARYVGRRAGLVIRVQRKGPASQAGSPKRGLPPGARHERQSQALRP